jgi:hypothetical protein
MDVSSLCVQVRGEGGVRVGASIEGAIIVVILGDPDLLGSGELLFHVMGDGLVLPCKDSSMLTRLGLAQGLACGTAATAVMRASCSWCIVATVARAATVASSSFWAAVAAMMVYCSSIERLEVLLNIVSKSVVVGGGEHMG